jgi:hypothetical protein
MSNKIAAPHGTTSLGVDDQPDVVLNVNLRHDSLTEPAGT